VTIVHGSLGRLVNHGRIAGEVGGLQHQGEGHRGRRRGDMSRESLGRRAGTGVEDRLFRGRVRVGGADVVQGTAKGAMGDVVRADTVDAARVGTKDAVKVDTADVVMEDMGGEVMVDMVGAGVDIGPRKLDLKSHGNWLGFL